MSYYNIISSVCIVLIVVLGLGTLSFILIDMIITTKTMDKACQDIGLKEAGNIDSIRTCKDYNGNLYYANIECSGLLWGTECKANLISVGNVRVVQND